MENSVKFRNHFSIVLPNLRRIIWMIILAFASAFLQEDLEEAIVTVATWIVLIVVLIVWQIIVWRKTWITVGNNSIIIERNTRISRKKNTIGIANISNVNLEQGLFAMLLGTCKLKLDTNSLSTANATDVTIVLKKKQAEELRALLMARITGEELQILENDKEADKNDQTAAVRCTDKRICVDTGNILVHGIFSSRFIYAILIPLYILFEFVTEMDSADIDYFIQEVGDFAAATIGITLFILVAVVSWMVLAMGFSLIRTAIKYWDFQIERREEKLVLQHGLTKKVNYSIPVNKIQAIVLKQSFLARVFKRYMVEVVNVGMNDDEKEAQSFLLPYCKKELLEERMRLLLPEFVDCLQLKAKRQPKQVWVVWIWSVLIYILIMCGMLFAAVEFLPEFLGIVCSAILVLSVTILVGKWMGYKTKGTEFGEEVLLSVTGSFSRKYVYMKYANIQYITLKQNFLAKRFGIQKAVVMLLASASNQAQEIPYFSEGKIENIKKRLLK